MKEFGPLLGYSIEMEQKKSENQKVEYEIGEGQKGRPCAIKVRPCYSWKSCCAVVNRDQASPHPPSLRYVTTFVSHIQRGNKI